MKKVIRENKISILIILVFILIGIFQMKSQPLVIQGDGNEYVLQAIAFKNHFSFGVSESDLQEAKSIFYNEASGLETVYYSDNPMHPYKEVRYSNHYGSYSALVAPVIVILDLIGVYPLWAFRITNFIIWLFALLIVMLCLKVEPIKKTCVVALLTFNPAWFYLSWTHSEIYMYAFVIIGLVFFYNHRWGLSIFFLSIAAMQNLGLLPFAMMVGIDLIIERINEYKLCHDKFSLSNFVKVSWKKIIPYGVFYIPGMMPIFATFIRFHTYSLVADVVTENKYLLHKAFDYLFDLNLGIFPYEPIILILFIVMCLLGVKKNIRASIINIIGVVGILFILANQLQINCGMFGIMRYGIWVNPIMIFFVVIHWENKKTNMGIVFTCVVESIFTFGIVVFCIWGNGYYASNQFAKWTEVVIDKFPQLYNPTHGIFYSRELGIETYASAYPVIYTNNEGYVRKILLSQEAKELFYADGMYLLIDEDDNTIIDKEKLKTFNVDENEYTYINVTGNVILTAEYNCGDTIYFDAERYNATAYVKNGIGNAENWGCWTNGDVAEFMLCIDSEEYNNESLTCNIDVGMIYGTSQRVVVYVNDEVTIDTVISGEEDITFPIRNFDSDLVDIKIKIPNSNVCVDGRDLGIGIVSMNIYNSDQIDDINSGRKPISIYHLGDRILFYSDEYNADKFALSGLSEKEEFGTWTDGTELNLKMRLNDYKDKYTCYIDIGGVYYHPQTVQIFVDGVQVAEQMVTEESKIEFDFEYSSKDVLELKFVLPDAISPMEVEESQDARDLGLYLKSLVISEKK